MLHKLTNIWLASCRALGLICHAIQVNFIEFDVQSSARLPNDKQTKLLDYPKGQNNKTAPRARGIATNYHK